MKRFDKQATWTLLTVVVMVLQLGAAGAIWFGREQARKALAADQMHASSLLRQLASQQERADGVATKALVPSRWHLLDGPDVATTMEVVNALGIEARVTFDAIKASTSNVAGKQSFQLSGHGTPQQVCEFLAAIEKHDRLIIVESGRLTPGGGELVAFDLGLATYHRGGVR